MCEVIRLGPSQAHRSRRATVEKYTMRLSWPRREMVPMTASFKGNFLLPLVCAFAIGMTVCWQLKPSSGASCEADQRAGRSALKSRGSWQDGAIPGYPHLSGRTHFDAALAMCLAVKDQHDDIREWIEHHISVGVGRFYIYDNGSEPPLNATIKDFIDSNIVEYRYNTLEFGSEATGRLFPQIQIYEECLTERGLSHHWMAFLDADEYLVMKEGGAAAESQSVPDFLAQLERFETYGGLAVAWEVFGSSNHKARPAGGILSNYHACLPRDSIHSRHVKTIVNTRMARAPLGPHHFSYREGYYAVDERFQRIDGPILPEGRGSVDKIALHHYSTKSFEDFVVKASLGSAMGNHKPLSFLDMIDNLATENCTAAMHLKI